MPEIYTRNCFLPDGEILYRHYWTEMGSARSIIKLHKWLTAQNFINQRTGKPVTAGAVWGRLWRWALKPENIAEAHKIFNDAMRDEGKFYTDQEWKNFLIKRAQCKSLLRGHEYARFLAAITLI